MACSTDRFAATYVVAPSLGPTACTTADFTDIQSAIDALPAGGGKIICRFRGRIRFLVNSRGCHSLISLKRGSRRISTSPKREWSFTSRMRLGSLLTMKNCFDPIGAQNHEGANLFGFFPNSPHITATCNADRS